MLPLKTVLHPTDFSEPCRAAFELACSIAREHGARLIVLHVTTVPDLAYQGYGVPGAPLQAEEYLTAARENLAQLRPAKDGIAVDRRIVEGDPAAEIVRAAAQEGVDLIVLGSHGQGALRRLLLGSVAEQVLRQAPCSVLIVKTPAPQTASP